MSYHSAFKLIKGTGRSRTRFDEKPAFPEGLYQISTGIYAWMVPNGSWGENNAGLLVGAGSSILIDTQWDLNYTNEMVAAMTPFLEQAPIKQLINTHADGDHFWGNQLFADQEIVATKAAAEESKHILPKAMKKFLALGRTMSKIPLRKTRQAGHWFTGMGKPYDFKPIRNTPAQTTFSGKMELTLDERVVQLLEVGPAHTKGDAIVYLPEAKVLFAGDILFIGSTPAIWAGPVENWLKALDLIESLEIKTIIPGHGPLCGKEAVQQVRDYWEFVLKNITREYKKGVAPVTAARTIATSDDFVSSPFYHWNSPERLMANTHTIYRNLSGISKAPTVPQLIKIMFHQAQLAHDLADAQPQVMRMAKK